MLKVYLVEDEKIVRDGIKQNISWESEGFEFCGEASDGEMALAMIRSANPDIIISDIKMPFIDGLELSRLLKQEMPWIHIIILSGYGDFEYTKQAIEIGVSDYILKPVSKADLLKVLHRAKEKIMKERKSSENKNNNAKRLSEKDLFFEALISNKKSASELFEYANKLSIDLIARYYNIILYKFYYDGSAKKQPNYINIKKETGEVIEKSTSSYTFELSDGASVVLLKSDTLDEIEKFENNVTEIIERLSEEKYEIDCFVGVGKPSDRLSCIRNSYDTAKACSRLVKRSHIVYSSRDNTERTKKKNQPMPDVGFDMREIQLDKMDKTIIDSFLKSGTADEAPAFVDEYFKNIGEKNMQSALIRQYLYMNLCFSCVSMMESLGYEKDVIIKDCGNFQDIYDDLFSHKVMKAYLIKVLETTIKYRNISANKKYMNIISDAKEYIISHFSDECISLNTVANYVNVSSSHFSAVFSQETGQTFVEFLTGVRMKKAKELLRCTNLKSSEICFEVGYKDPHYFSYLFKKTQGCTPKEYRAKGRF